MAGGERAGHGVGEGGRRPCFGESFIPRATGATEGFKTEGPFRNLNLGDSPSIRETREEAVEWRCWRWRGEASL